MAVLIFEKSKDLTKRLIDLIKETEIESEIFTADSYTDASVLLQQNNAKVVLLDLHFSGDLSMDLLQLVKKKNKNIVAIIMYTYASEYDLHQCRSLGANFLFSKYDDFEKIPAVIRAIYK